MKPLLIVKSVRSIDYSRSIGYSDDIHIVRWGDPPHQSGPLRSLVLQGRLSAALAI
jgi:hypothetical protein